VPWKQGEAKQETAEQKEEKKQVAIKLTALANEMSNGDRALDNPKQNEPYALGHPEFRIPWTGGNPKQAQRDAVAASTVYHS
jgi:hypothetical protein